MKTSNLIYTFGLILIAASILLMVLSPESGRVYMIAGGLTILGFPLNIFGFIMKKTKSS